MRLDGLHDRVRDLVGHPLLHLEPPGEHVHNARDLGQPQDLAVGNVGHVGPPEERQQVVLAQGVELDVPHHDHALVAFLEHRVTHHLGDRLAIPLGQKAQRVLHPIGSLDQALAGRVFPQ